jgi:hypothetical protein
MFEAGKAWLFELAGADSLAVAGSLDIFNNGLVGPLKAVFSSSTDEGLD